MTTFCIAFYEVLSFYGFYTKKNFRRMPYYSLSNDCDNTLKNFDVKSPFSPSNVLKEPSNQIRMTWKWFSHM